MAVPWVDIIFFVILVIFAIVGVSRGFLKSLVALFGTLLTLVVAILLSKPVAGLVDSWFGLSSVFQGMMVESLHETFQGGIPFLLNGIITTLMGADYMAGVTDETIRSMEFASDVALKLGNLITFAICIIVLYILIRIVLWLLSKLFDAITQNRAINGLDRVLGLVLGAAKGVLCLFILFGVAFLLSSLIPSLGSTIDYWIEQNTVSHAFYNWTRDIIENTILPFFFG